MKKGIKLDTRVYVSAQKNCHVYKEFKSKWKPDLFSPLSTLVAINRFVQRLAVPGIPKEEFCPDFL